MVIYITKLFLNELFQNELYNTDVIYCVLCHQFQSGDTELETYSVESGKLDHTVKLSVHVLRQEKLIGI